MKSEKSRSMVSGRTIGCQTSLRRTSNSTPKNRQSRLEGNTSMTMGLGISSRSRSALSIWVLIAIRRLVVDRLAVAVSSVAKTLRIDWLKSRGENCPKQSHTIIHPTNAPNLSKYLKLGHHRPLGSFDKALSLV